MLAHAGKFEVGQSVFRAIEQERKEGLEEIETYLAFARRCEAIRRELKAVLIDANRKSRPVLGYGATAKSTTVLNYCDIGSDLIEFIADSTPVKQGKVIPGTGIPIRPPSAFRACNHQYTLLLAWNHRAEIERKEAAYRERGGKWIIYIPGVATV